jgi:hypothetical protein
MTNPKQKLKPKPKQELAIPQSSGGLVFISHDTRDAEIAEAFGDLVTNVGMGFLEIFRSSDRKGTQGIEYGAEWYQNVMERLDNSTTVVALLTPQSVGRPWILYETGVAIGKSDKTVFGLALGMGISEASQGPFSNFQNSGDGKDDLIKLLVQLISKHVPKMKLDHDYISTKVDEFKEKMKKLLPKSESGKALKKPDEEEGTLKLFQEIKLMIRQLEDKISPQQQGTLSLRTKTVDPEQAAIFLDETDLVNSAAKKLGIERTINLLSQKGGPSLLELSFEPFTTLRRKIEVNKTKLNQFELEAITWNLKGIAKRFSGTNTSSYVDKIIALLET